MLRNSIRRLQPKMLPPVLMLTSARIGKPKLFFTSQISMIGESDIPEMLNVCLTDSDVIDCFGTMEDVTTLIASYEEAVNAGVSLGNYLKDWIIRCEPMKFEDEKTAEDLEEEELENSVPSRHTFSGEDPAIPL